MADTLFPHASAPAAAPGRMDSLPAASTWEETARAAVAENAALKLEAHRRANELADCRGAWRQQERGMLAESERLGLEAHSLRLQLKGCTDAKEDAVRLWQSAEEASAERSREVAELSEQLEAVRAAKKARDEENEALKAQIAELAHARPQCCMCGKKNLSTEEDGGPECELSDGRWVCSSACWHKAASGLDVEEAARARDGEVRNLTELRDAHHKQILDLRAERDQLRKWVAEGEARLVEAKAETFKVRQLRVETGRLLDEALAQLKPPSSPQANSSADKLRLIREFVALVTEEGAR